MDFKRLKKVQEFKDWYAYACKLEDSVKFLRDRMRNLETDHDALNDKYRKEVSQREQLFHANEQLSKTIRRAHLKLAEVKERCREKFSRRCANCESVLEGTLGFNSTIDKHFRSLTSEMNQSAYATQQPKPSPGRDSFGERLELEGALDPEVMLDNLLIEEPESDKARSKLYQSV